MKGIASLKIVTDALQDIGLSQFQRPTLKPGDHTEELMQWGICVFLYSLLAHLKEILAGLVQLSETENFAASAPICRHIFE